MPLNPSEVPPDTVDIARLDEFTCGDDEQLRELIDLYVTQTTEQLKALGAAIQSQQAKPVEQLAHKAAGSSATCGMLKISPILRQLEGEARAQNLGNAPAHFQQIEQEFERIKQIFAPYLTKPGGS